jgi:hypothetical protein
MRRSQATSASRRGSTGEITPLEYAEPLSLYSSVPQRMVNYT